MSSQHTTAPGHGAEFNELGGRPEFFDIDQWLASEYLNGTENNRSFGDSPDPMDRTREVCLTT